MKLLLILFMLIPITSMANIGEMTSEELAEALIHNQRCELSPSNDSAKDHARSVSVIAAETVDGDTAYFAEVVDSEDNKIIYYLPKTHVIIGGYKSEGSRYLKVGFKISASVNYLSQVSGGRGTDVSVTISPTVLSAKSEYYNHCNF